MLIKPIPTTEIDHCRVDSIRDQLDEDRYIPDPQQIADKIIDLEVALLGYP